MRSRGFLPFGVRLGYSKHSTTQSRPLLVDGERDRVDDVRLGGERPSPPSRAAP